MILNELSYCHYLLIQCYNYQYQLNFIIHHFIILNFLISIMVHSILNLGFNHYYLILLNHLNHIIIINQNHRIKALFDHLIINLYFVRYLIIHNHLNLVINQFHIQPLFQLKFELKYFPLFHFNFPIH